MWRWGQSNTHFTATESYKDCNVFVTHSKKEKVGGALNKSDFEVLYGLLVLLNTQPRHKHPAWVTETSTDATTEADS